MKKQISLAIIILLLFGIFLYFYLSPRSYINYYYIDGYKVIERYENKYYFEISKNNKVFNYFLNTKYRPLRGLIKEIDTYQEKSDTCIYFNIKGETTFPICYRDNQLIDFRLINSESFSKFLENKYNSNSYEINKKVKNIIIHNYDDSIYALWNYHSLIYVNKEIEQEIEIFVNDQYDNKLTVLVNNLLFIPNYNQKHFFNEAIIINLDNGKKEVWNLKNTINYESNILGIIDNDLYLIDEKEEQEYKINIKDKKITNITSEEGFGIINYQGKWQEEKITNIINKNLRFLSNNQCQYYLKKDLLYYKDYHFNNSYLISLQPKPKIIFSKECQIYYLVEDTLYTYYPQVGELKLLSNYDWKFTADNKVFIYKK